MKLTEDQVKSVLTEFDGRRVAPLKALVLADPTGRMADTVLRAIPGPDEIAATWCLKAWAEARQLSADTLSTTFARLEGLKDPDAILHVLQMVQHAPDLARPYQMAIQPLAGHPKLLINVWAFDAFCRTIPEDQSEDRAARIRAGLSHRSKAMQARARGLAREFGANP